MKFTQISLIIISVFSITSSAEPLKPREQIREYQEIYGEIYRQNPTDPQNTHSEPLYHKLSDAFLLTKEYIEQDVKETQNEYLNHLKMLEVAAAFITYDDKKMTPLNFERINTLCASIGQAYYETPEMLETPMVLPNIFETPEEGKRAIKEIFQQGEIQDIVGLIYNTYGEMISYDTENDIRYKRRSKIFFPMAIIYMKRHVGISYRSFVDLYFNPQFPMTIAIFYPVPQPSLKKGKKYVHYSSLNDLFSMLEHDFFHRNQTNSALEIYYQHLNLDFIGYLAKIYRFAQTLDSERHILINGLFLLLHEFPSMPEEDIKIAPHYKANDHTLLTDNIDALLDTQLNLLGDIESLDYKIGSADDEYILFDLAKKGVRDSYNEPFLPLIKINHQFKLLPFAHDPEGNITIALGRQTDKGQVLIDLNAEENSSINYSTDNQGNIVLVDGWKWIDKNTVTQEIWMLNEKIRELATLTYRLRSDSIGTMRDEAKSELKKRIIEAYEQLDNIDKRLKRVIATSEMRIDYKINYLANGFTRFWSYFLEIAEQGFEAQK